jgi:SAM-dependent methyltransferase
MPMIFKKLLIQASSRSWCGAPDLCMNKINGITVFEMTLNKVLEFFNDEFEIVVIAPEFEFSGDLHGVVDSKFRDKVSLICSHDASPLMRIYESCKDIHSSDYIIRLDALNYFAQLDLLEYVSSIIDKYKPDCIKFPDDFPPAFSFDIYRVGCIRRLVDIGIDPVFQVHPKYFCTEINGFSTFVIDYSLHLTDTYLLECREFMSAVYDGDRMEVDEEKIVSSADQLSFHYELALKYLSKDDFVLDIACGNGYGTRLIAPNVKEIIGADIDEQIIIKARRFSAGLENISFQVDDITNLSFHSESFDVILSMETIEHVDVEKYCKEILRTLKPNGKLIMSTPQNFLGHIPINSSHHIEFSYQSLKGLLEKYFSVISFVGIKQGRIILEGQTTGNNSFVVCQKA